MVFPMADDHPEQRDISIGSLAGLMMLFLLSSALVTLVDWRIWTYKIPDLNGCL